MDPPTYQYQMLAEQLSGKTNMSLVITFNTVKTSRLTLMTYGTLLTDHRVYKNYYSGR